MKLRTLISVLIILALTAVLCGCPPVKTTHAAKSDTEKSDIANKEKPAETKPAETKPTETKPAGTRPAETKPTETKPAETKPAETKPAETRPAETKPTETKPTETKPAETKPAGTIPAKQKPPTNKKLNPQKKPKAANDPPENSEDEENTPAFYKQYKELLATYVDDQGRVDYRTLRRKRAILATIVREIDDVHPAKILSWSRKEKMAFWINTYNIMTLKLIIDEYPIQPVWYMFTYPDNSIMQIPGAWTRKYFKVIGMEYTLSEIKDGILMARFSDPRVCFALSFASVGSAFLRNEPYYPKRLDKQLDDQVKKYLASPKGLKIDKTKKMVHLSDIFNWNKKDFVAKYGHIKRFRNQKPEMRAYLNFITLDDLGGDGRYLYISEETAKYLKNGNYRIALEPYKWHLNEQR